MDPSILKKIYKDTATTKVAVESIDSTMQKLLKFQNKELKEEEKYRKEQKAEKRRESQLKKREETDSIKKENKEKKETEEGKKGIGDIIKDALGGLVSGLKGLLSGIGPLIAGGLAGLGGIIGGAVSGALGLVGGALGGIIGGAIKGLSKMVMGALKPALALLKGGLAKLAAKGLLGLAAKAVAAVALPGAAAVGIAYGAGKLAQEGIKASYGGGQAGDLGLDMYNEGLRINAAGTNSRGRRTRPMSDKEKAQMELIEATREALREAKKDRDAALKKATKTTGSGRSKKTSIDPESRAEIMAEYDEKIAVLAEKYDTKFQSGGMIPTLLEPGEKVFMPGQWDDNVRALNGIIPRFQTGGLVQTTHPDTGPGWSMGKDQQGRPVVLHKSAAQSLMDAIKSSNGMVKTSDITSSQRSVDKNRAVGGVPNSNHLTGYAMDIHGTSKAWLKENGPKYGWKNLVYSGHDGHFDHKGATVQAGDGKERTADTDGSQGGGLFDGIKSILEGMGGVFEGVTGLFAGIGEGLGELDLGGFGKELLGGLGGGIMGVGGLGAGLFEGVTGISTGGVDVSKVTGGAYGKDSLINALNSAGITDKKERAMFLSQMHHESGGFRYSEEIHDGSDYEGRSDLGNNRPGDGKKYKGRGYIQLTGRSNYRQYGKLVGADLENKPELAADPEIAAKVALAYWNKRVNRTAAQNGDVLTVTRNINGGTNGLQDRRNLYADYSRQGYQTGGVTSISGNNNTVSRMRAAQEKFAESIAEATNPAPIVVFEDAPTPTIAQSGHLNNKVPDLPDGPSTVQAAEYFYKLNLGGNI